MGRLEVPAEIGDYVLIHGEDLREVAEVTCVSEDGGERPLGEDIAAGVVEGRATEDPPPTLFDIGDFGYETFQSAYYTRDLDALLAGGDCAALIDDMFWTLILDYVQPAELEPYLALRWEGYDVHVDEGHDLGCLDRDGRVECWGRTGALLVISSSHAPMAEQSGYAEELVTGLSLAG